MRALLKGGLASMLAGVLGCSLLVDTSDLDSGCPEGTKLCPGEGCVDLGDPAYGCTPTSCSPCPNVRNAVAECRDLQCQRTCLEGFGCANCLVDLLTDEGNCGGCCSPGLPCEFACEEGERCKDGRCAVPLQ